MDRKDDVRSVPITEETQTKSRITVHEEGRYWSERVRSESAVDRESRHEAIWSRPATFPGPVLRRG
jgi:hypothetical protein